MSSTIETVDYSYDDEACSLEGDEALEVYRREKALHPDALVVLDLLHCNKHWDVKTYQTKHDKSAYFEHKIRRILEQFVAGLKR